jgi:hypothetical protein
MPDHERVRLRETFDAAAERYDRARPGYPAAMFDDLADLAGVGPGCRVLEIGSGTGQATAPLAGAGVSGRERTRPGKPVQAAGRKPTIVPCLASIGHDTGSPRAGEMPPRPPELHLHTKGDWRYTHEPTGISGLVFEEVPDAKPMLRRAGQGRRVWHHAQ